MKTESKVLDEFVEESTESDGADILPATAVRRIDKWTREAQTKVHASVEKEVHETSSARRSGRSDGADRATGQTRIGAEPYTPGYRHGKIDRHARSKQKVRIT